MRKIFARISILTLIALLSAAALFLAAFCSASFGVASADYNENAFPYADAVASADDVEYFNFAPANPTAGGTAGVSSVPVKDTITGQIEFYVPESYYVKVIKFNPDTSTYTVDFSNVSAINGKSYYIKESDLNGITPQAVAFGITDNPYPTTLLQLNEGETLNFGGTTITAADGYTLRYVGGFRDEGGNVLNDEIYITAVKGNVSFAGRVPKSSFAPFGVPYHPITEASLSPKPDNPSGGDGSITPTSSKTLRIILIIGIIVPAVIIVILLFKPSKDGNNYDKRAMRKSRKVPDVDYDRDRTYDNRRDYDRRDYDRRDYERDYDRRDYDRGARRDYDDRLGYDEKRLRDRRSYNDRDDRYDR